MSDLQNSSERVAGFRKRTGWSRDELARHVGYSQNYIGMIERGEKEPGPRFWRDLEHAEQLFSQTHTSDFRGARGEQLQPRGQTRIEESGIHAGGARGHLRQAREERGLSVAELAKLTKISAAHLNDLEQGRAQMSEQVLTRLKKALPDLDTEELMGGSDSPRIIDLSGRTGTVGSTPHVTLPNGQTARFVPRLADAEAGALVEWTDDIYEHEGVLALDLPPRSRAFCVKVRGDSMIPNYLPGDDVIVLWGVEPRNGQVVVACTIEGEPLIKIYNSQEQGRKVILSSYNPVHLPRPFDREELRWIWPVHSFSRQVM